MHYTPMLLSEVNCILKGWWMFSEVVSGGGGGGASEEGAAVRGKNLAAVNMASGFWLMQCAQL